MIDVVLGVRFHVPPGRGDEILNEDPKLHA